MSRTDDKRKIFSKIGSFSSMNEINNLSNNTDSFSSVNNKEDSVTFLLDILKTTAGSVAINEAVGGMMGSVLDDSEPKIKESLKKQFNQPNSGKNLPNDFISNGVNLSAEDIDVGGKLKTPKNSEVGDLLYGNNENDFDSALRDAIVNEGTEVDCNNMKILFDSNSENFTIKPNNDSDNCGDFVNNFIDNTQIFNKDEIVTNVMDDIFGTISNEIGKTEDEIYNELQYNQLLKQLVNGDDSMNLNQDVLDELFYKAKNKSKGVTVLDFGCGKMDVTLPLSGLTTLVNNLSNVDEHNNIEQLSNTFDSVFNDENSRDNRETINDGIIKLIIDGLTVKMIEKVVISPQIRTLMGVVSTFDGNEPQIGDVKEDMKKWKKFIICMKKEIMIIIGALLFALVVKFLIKLLKPTMKRVIEEKMNNFKSTINSLTLNI